MATGSLLEPPARGRAAAFADGFGQRVLLTVDTEEEFDWNAPFARDAHGLTHVGEIARFQSFAETIGAHPVYMVDYPITRSPEAVQTIRAALERGKADLGAQLHSWVTPPFEEELHIRNSFAGNLPPELEAAKFSALSGALVESFSTMPQIYRAGRYGVGPQTHAMLRQARIALDSSVRTLFDYSEQDGPDFTHHPAWPYWADAERTLLELPLTSVYWGMLRQLGPQIHRLQRHAPTFFGGLSRLGLLERIALTPEGVTAEEAIRGIDIALDDGLPLLVLSFHTPSLSPGHTPYVKSEADVARVYGWFEQVYAYLDKRGIKSASLDDVINNVRR